MKNKIILGLELVLVVFLIASMVSALSVDRTSIKIAEGVDEGKAISSTYVVSSSEQRVVSADFKVVNDFKSEKQIRIQRWLDPNEELVSHNGELKYSQMEHYSRPYLEYKAVLGKGESADFELNIKYKRLRTIQDSPIIAVFDDLSGELITQTNPEFIKLKCKEDSVCDVNIGENHRNCPADCASGEEDGFCDMKIDGKCDPNCLTELDPDCLPGEGKSIPKIPTYELEEPEQITSPEEKPIIGFVGSTPIYADESIEENSAFQEQEIETKEKTGILSILFNGFAKVGKVIADLF
ncbi:MAG: hypothetical protein KKB31_02370 [Nanoarchaeota archaeon]|nr:hypothetical protein [Nanoarchaeota archaeon]